MLAAEPPEAEFAGSLARALGVGMAGGAHPVDLAAVDPDDFEAPRDDRPPAAKSLERCDRRGPSRRRGGVSSDGSPVALAELRSCKKPPKARPSTQPMGRGMPGEPLLQMLRQRIMPVARGCFRRDRAGRPDYQVRAEFLFRLAEAEVVSARVEGKIGPALRACLLRAVDTLDVPRFSGTVNVRYPLVTARESVPAQIELTPETQQQLDALLR